MFNPTRLIFLHGLESSSQSGKAVLLRECLPGILTPDFTGSLQERMTQLYPILGDKTGWTLIGSSFGGFMAALFTCQHPEQVRKLILLAPALSLPEFAGRLPAPEDEDIPGKVARRQHRFKCLLDEARAQGASPTHQQLADALGFGLRTLERDMVELRL